MSASRIAKPEIYDIEDEQQLREYYAGQRGRQKDGEHMRAQTVSVFKVSLEGLHHQHFHGLFRIIQKTQLEYLNFSIRLFRIPFLVFSDEPVNGCTFRRDRNAA
jgi:hypothetical protein